MVLFNQLTLGNFLNRRDDLGTPEVCMVVAALAEEQKADALLFLNNNIEALAAHLSGLGSLAVELVKGLLDGMPTLPQHYPCQLWQQLSVHSVWLAQRQMRTFSIKFLE